MSQRDRILKMLRDAGPRGVHSHRFYEERMPRGAAVVHALKPDLAREGLTIKSVPETLPGGAKGTRYTLVKTAGGEVSSPSRDRAVRDQDPPRREVATPPAVHDEPEPFSLFGADPAISLDGAAGESRKPSAYDPFRDSEAA